MCTVIVLRRPGDTWPTLLAANRDERLDRAWDPPAAWWPDRPGVVGGRDRSAGGTWMAASPHGLVAAVLNRPGSLGPAPGKRSRGELPLLALEQPDAAAAAAVLARLSSAEWRPFNMVVADRAAAFFLRGLGEGPVQTTALPEGVSMVTAQDPNDLASPRTARHLPRFRATTPPDPDRDDWSGWEKLLADDHWEASIAEALNVPPVGGFGTVCASLVAIGAEGALRWRFAAGRPGAVTFREVALG
ncbi:MAG TPA: NRDE family protein [Crenalkalicoccus sp.]|nr:NRDE family protein [Crenalkalicoccus sp.]